MNPGSSDTSDFQALHATPHLIPLFAGSLSTLNPYIVMVHKANVSFKSPVVSEKFC